MALDMPATGSSTVTIRGVNVPLLTIPGIAANVAIGTLAIPASLIGIVKYAYLDLVIGASLVTVNAQTNGAQIIEVDNAAAGGYTTAINVPDGSVRTETVLSQLSRSNITLCGTTDIKAKATLGETLTARWTAALAAGGAITLYDTHLELRLIF